MPSCIVRATLAVALVALVALLALANGNISVVGRNFKCV